MLINHGMHCCGMREISHLSDQRSPEDAMRQFVKMALFNYTYDWAAPRATFIQGMPPQAVSPRRSLHGAHFIFTQATKTAKYGLGFAKLIEDYKLGALTATEWKVNPNSRRPVKCWVWTPDLKALRKWYQANKKATT